MWDTTTRTECGSPWFFLLRSPQKSEDLAFPDLEIQMIIRNEMPEFLDQIL
jgi:hypothetical protein